MEIDINRALAIRFGAEWGWMTPYTRDIAREAFKCAIKVSQPPTVQSEGSEHHTIADIMMALDLAVEDVFGMTRIELLGATKTPKIVDRRDMYFYLFRQLIDCSLNECIRLNNIKYNHSSLISSEKRFLIRKDLEWQYRKTYEKLKDKTLCILKEMK